MIPVASLLLALALAAALAYQVLQAERSQRAVAEGTLTDYADFAAFILASRVFGSLQPEIAADLDAVRQVAIGDEPASALAPLLAGCSSDPDGRSRWAFHLDFEADAFETWGDVPRGVGAWVQDTLRTDVLRDEYGRFPFTHVWQRAPGSAGIVYAAQRDAWNQAVRAFGITPCFERGERSVFELSLAGTPALPPSLTGALPNDSVVSVDVRSPAGSTIWRSAGRFGDRYAGSAEVWGPFGGLRLHAAVRPDLADRLVRGGMPRSRLPLTFGLLALASGLVLAAVYQLRREHELVRLREGFVSSVSHELRTPLQQVLLFVELLRMKKLRTPDEESRSLEIVEEETRRLINLVENLLQFSRAGRTETTVDPRRIELAPVVRQTIEAFEPLARAGRATVLCDARPVEAWADPDAVRRILLNLLDNAVKYGPPGQTVRVFVRAANGRVLLRVDDEGEGIRPEDRARVWEPFFRARARTDETGSGIGLAIVRELTLLQGGEVAIDSAPSGGARFTVSLRAKAPGEKEAV